MRTAPWSSPVQPSITPSASRAATIPRAVALVLVGLFLAACGTSVAPASPGPSPTAGPSPKPVTSTPATGGVTPSPSSHPIAYPLTLIDDGAPPNDVGSTIILSAMPMRIVSLTPATTETLFALGVGSRVVGGTDADDYPAAARALPHVVSNQVVLVEKLVALRPDLVVAGRGVTPSDVIDQLRSLGLTVLVVSQETIARVLHGIELIGTAVGVPDAAASLTSGLTARIGAIADAAQPTGPRLRVFYEVDATRQIYGPAADSYLAEMISLAGGAPITSGIPDVWAISLERLVAGDPQVIVLGDSNYGVTPADVRSRPGWSGMAAVLQHAIRPVDDTIVTRPGPRIADGLAALALAINPALVLPTPAPSAIPTALP